MRPTGRILKLSVLCPVVVLKENDNGEFIADHVEGYHYDAQAEDLSIADAEQEEAKPTVELRTEIESCRSASELGRNASNAYAAKFLGYKNADLNVTQRELAKSEARRKAWAFDYKQMLEIANIIARKEHLYLKSGRESDKVRLTYIDIAQEYKDASEATVRRLVKEMKLRIGARADTVDVSQLMVRSRMWEVHREIAILREIYPSAGAPKLHALLNDKGVKVSQRTVGKLINLPCEALLLL